MISGLLFTFEKPGIHHKVMKPRASDRLNIAKKRTKIRNFHYIFKEEIKFYDILMRNTPLYPA